MYTKYNKRVGLDIRVFESATNRLFLGLDPRHMNLTRYLNISGLVQLLWGPMGSSS